MIAAPSNTDNDMGSGQKREGAYFAIVGAVAVVLSLLPYLVGWWQTPPGHVFTGFIYNGDDGAVYLSWMRQTANGAFTLRNQFTTEPQRGVVFNLLFSLLGGIVRLTHWDARAVYFGARVAGNALLCAALAWLCYTLFRQPRTRRIAYTLALLGSGLGWLWGGYLPERANNQPVDLWQPEAVTFLSLYYAPLFTFALAAIVVYIASLVRTERAKNGDTKGVALRELWPALVCGFLLGNFHTYDVVPLFGVSLAYRAVTDIANRRLSGWGWGRVILLGAAMFPTVAYQGYALRVETVFYERAFVSSTPSPAVWWVLAGFGLPVGYALLGLVPKVRAKLAALCQPPAMKILILWAIVGVGVMYLPVSFQRKMIMGAYLPVCLLGGAALSALTANLSGDFPKIATLFGILLTLPSNALFLLREIDRVQTNTGSTDVRPYRTDNEEAALRYLHDNTHPTDAVLVSPDPTAHRRFPGYALKPYLGVWVPAVAGNVVYNGHWSETMSYNRKFGNMTRFFAQDTTDNERIAFLHTNNIRYVLQARALGDVPLREGNDGSGSVFYRPVRWPARVPSYLQIVYQNPEVVLYRVGQGLPAP